MVTEEIRVVAIRAEETKSVSELYLSLCIKVATASGMAQRRQIISRSRLPILKIKILKTNERSGISINFPKLITERYLILLLIWENLNEAPIEISARGTARLDKISKNLKIGAGIS